MHEIGGMSHIHNAVLAYYVTPKIAKDRRCLCIFYALHNWPKTPDTFISAHSKDCLCSLTIS